MDSTNLQTHTGNILQWECLFFANTAMQLLSWRTVICRDGPEKKWRPH